MMWQRLVLLGAALIAGCGASDDVPPAGTDPDTTDTDTTDTDTTDTDTTDTETTDTGTVPPVNFGTPDIDVSPAVLTGVVARCDDAEHATVIGEFMGPIGTVTAAPIVDGALLDAVPLAIEERSLFHRGEGTLMVADCEATGWRVIAAVNGRETCIVTGSGADAWLATSGADCELR